jgi:hypothetical protein
MWTPAVGHHEDRWPMHGYEPTREVAMAAFATGQPGGGRRRAISVDLRPCTH